MKSSHRVIVNSTAVVLILGLSGCSGMTTREKDTAIGAGAGAVAGAVLTGGVIGTGVGAAVGGVIGNEVGKGEK